MCYTLHPYLMAREVQHQLRRSRTQQILDQLQATDGIQRFGQKVGCTHQVGIDVARNPRWHPTAHQQQGHFRPVPRIDSQRPTHPVGIAGRQHRMHKRLVGHAPRRHRILQQQHLWHPGRQQRADLLAPRHLPHRQMPGRQQVATLLNVGRDRIHPQFRER